MIKEMSDWGQLVGKTGEEAKVRILEDMPDADVHILPEGSPVTFDYRFNRVRVFVDGQDKVVTQPHIG